MEEKKYLDYQGLQTYHENLLTVLEEGEHATAEALDDLDDRLKVIENKNPYSKSEIDNLLDPITDKLENIEEFAEVNIQSDWNLTDTTADDYIKNKPGVGVANGLATLNSSGKIPSSQLPSYVDDVIEGYYHGEEDPQSGETVYNMYEDDEYTILITPESGKIYLDIPTSNSYRWSGLQYVLIGAHYDLPIASANTLGGVKVGENLSIDQNGVLSALASTVDSYTKQQSDDKYTIIKDSATAPTESTLTYTENGTVKNFKQGDEVRVPDAEADNGYTFYKLYELTTSGNTTTATWDKLGAGGGIDLNEIVCIHLTTNQDSSYDSDLIGATVTVTNDDTNETIYTGTWDGSDIFVEVTNLTNYTVTVGAVTDYATPAAQSFYAKVGYSRNVNFIYNTEVVSVICCTMNDSTPIAGQTITINGATYISASTPVNAKVAYGTIYTVSVNDRPGVITPIAQEFTASQQLRNVTIKYLVIGVFVESTDGNFYTASNWGSSGKTANAVAVITTTCRFRIALTQVSKAMHRSRSDSAASYLTAIPNETNAKADLKGAENTENVIRYNKAYSSDTTTYAAPYCKAFVWPNGQTGAYVPAEGQLWIAYQNITAINACLSACGGTTLASQYWSSTFYANQSGFWVTNMYTGNTDWIGSENAGQIVRPCSDL